MSKRILPLVVISTLGFAAYVVSSNPPTVKRAKPSGAPQLNVQVQQLQPRNLAIDIASYGTVRPRTQSILLPQVSGQIIEINPKFREGGFFEKGEVLVKLDQRDLLAEINIAKASLYSAKQKLSEEQARVEQAKQDWLRLGNTQPAPDLVMRKPQLLAAQAGVYSAQASLAKAELALERSEIIAPYTGRVLTKSVDIGQVVNVGTQLAEIYAVDYVEVRLPLKNKDLPFINLPENNRFNTSSNSVLPDVAIKSELAPHKQWLGKIVRTEGAFDQNSQQLFVVAQIDDPYAQLANQGIPLKIGQYVNANIAGNVIEQALTIPNKAIYQGSYVYIVEQNVLKRRNIDIAWQNDDIAMIGSGLTIGEQIVLTPLGQVTSGTPVQITAINGKPIAKRGNKSKRKGKAPNRGEQS